MDFLRQYESDARELMRLQTLKLKAFLATSSGNVKESSQNHKLAIANPENNTMALANQLRWKDRVPVNFHTLDYYLASEFDLDQIKAKDSNQWNKILNMSTASPEIFVWHACGDFKEQLSVELLSAEKQTNEARVRLKESSALSNYLRAGKMCTCRNENLRLANP